MKKALLISLVLLFLLTSVGEVFAKDKTPTLYIHCGAGLSPAMDKIKKAFEAKHDCKVDYSYKGSGCLLADITFSHRGDLYLPGESFYINKAEKKGFISKSQNIAYWSAVVITPKNNPKNIQSFYDLARPGVRIALGDEEACAIGKKQVPLLKKAGIYDEVQKNVVTRTLTVNHLATQAKLGHVDAAIVWTSTAIPIIDDVLIIAPPEDIITITSVPIGILKFTKHPEMAQSFLDFLSTDEAKEIFHASGYSTKKEEVYKDLKKFEERSKSKN
ncbi:MAG: molybdate ABC transporter substrate-binding protein [Vulcanimicrobiota bacterium]